MNKDDINIYTVQCEIIQTKTDTAKDEVVKVFTDMNIASK